MQRTRARCRRCRALLKNNAQRGSFHHFPGSWRGICPKPKDQSGVVLDVPVHRPLSADLAKNPDARSPPCLTLSRTT